MLKMVVLVCPLMDSDCTLILQPSLYAPAGNPVTVPGRSQNLCCPPARLLDDNCSLRWCGSSWHASAYGCAQAGCIRSDIDLLNRRKALHGGIRDVQARPLRARIRVLRWEAVTNILIFRHGCCKDLWGQPQYNFSERRYYHVIRSQRKGTGSC